MALHQVACIQDNGSFAWESDVFASTDKGIQEREKVEAEILETVELLDVPLESVKHVMTEKNRVGAKWILSFKEPWQSKLASKKFSTI